MNTDFNYTEEDFKGMFGASEDDGIFTGYYNIITNNKIIYTDYFVLENEEQDSELVKQIMIKHKTDFKNANIQNVSIEILNITFYSREESITTIKDILSYQLPIVKEEMTKLNNTRNTFDFTDISKLLDNM